MPVNNKSMEALLHRYYEAEDADTVIPDENKILAFMLVENNERLGKQKHKFRRIMIAISACLILVLVTSFAISKHLGNNNVYFGDVNILDQIAEWYSPRELSVNAVILETTKSPVSAKYSPSSVVFLSYSNTAVKSVTEDRDSIPEWVTSVQILNERFTRLYADTVPDSYGGGFLVYDAENEQIYSIVSMVYNAARDFFDERNINERTPNYMINIIEFEADTNNCIFDTWNETTEPWVRERYIIDLNTGELSKIPLKNFIAVSDDGRYIVQSTDEYVDGELIQRKIIALNTETMEETVIVSSGEKASLPMLHVDFSDDGRFIVSYLYNKNKTNGGWDMPGAEWVLYDTVNSTTVSGKGKIIRFTEGNDAVIVRDTENARILLLEDMSDVTNKYNLKTYERYEFISSYTDGICSLRLSPIFGDGNDVLITDNAVSFSEWNGFLYIYEYGSNDVLVYSFENNEAFRCEIDNTVIPNERFDVISVFVFDSGKKCNIVAWDNPLE